MILSPHHNEIPHSLFCMLIFPFCDEFLLTKCRHVCKEWLEEVNQPRYWNALHYHLWKEPASFDQPFLTFAERIKIVGLSEVIQPLYKNEFMSSLREDIQKIRTAQFIVLHQTTGAPKFPTETLERFKQISRFTKNIYQYLKKNELLHASWCLQECMLIPEIYTSLDPIDCFENVPVWASKSFKLMDIIARKQTELLIDYGYISFKMKADFYQSGFAFIDLLLKSSNAPLHQICKIYHQEHFSLFALALTAAYHNQVDLFQSCLEVENVIFNNEERQWILLAVLEDQYEPKIPSKAISWNVLEFILHSGFLLPCIKNNLSNWCSHLENKIMNLIDYFIENKIPDGWNDQQFLWFLKLSCNQLLQKNVHALKKITEQAFYSGFAMLFPFIKKNYFPTNQKEIISQLLTHIDIAFKKGKDRPTCELILKAILQEADNQKKIPRPENPSSQTKKKKL